MTETTRQNAIRSLAVPLILIAACGASAGASALVKRLQKQESPAYTVQSAQVDTAMDTGWQRYTDSQGALERRVTRGVNSDVTEYRIDSNSDGVADLYRRVACGHDAYAKYACTTTESTMPSQ